MGKKGSGYTPGREQGNRAFLERKSRSIPSTRAVSWRASFCPGEKIDRCQLNFRPLDVVFSGIGRVRRLAQDSIFKAFFVAAHSKCAEKACLYTQESH